MSSLKDFFNQFNIEEDLVFQDQFLPQSDQNEGENEMSTVHLPSSIQMEPILTFELTDEDGLPVIKQEEVDLFPDFLPTEEEDFDQLFPGTSTQDWSDQDVEDFLNSCPTPSPIQDEKEEEADLWTPDASEKTLAAIDALFPRNHGKRIFEENEENEENDCKKKKTEEEKENFNDKENSKKFIFPQPVPCQKKKSPLKNQEENTLFRKEFNYSFPNISSSRIHLMRSTAIKGRKDSFFRYYI